MIGTPSGRAGCPDAGTSCTRRSMTMLSAIRLAATPLCLGGGPALDPHAPAAQRMTDRSRLQESA
ncbi:MAG: hypothetical protein O9972_47660 [Burkholderiales bacterium]|nr:hypothetical protein [Burkholderiales bacterium]